MSFQGVIEKAITHHLFRRDGRQGCRYGLPVPLYWWTHRALTIDAAVKDEVDHTMFLLNHLAASHVSPSAVAVVCATDAVLDALKVKVNAASATHTAASGSVFAGRLFTLRSLADPATPVGKTGVAVLCLGGFACATTADALRGPCLEAAFAAGPDALIMIGHALWPGFSASSHPLAVGHRKLLEERWQLSSTTGSPATADEGLPKADSLVGGVLPICCPTHPAEVALITHELIRQRDAHRFCRRRCLQPCSCKRHNHLCPVKCHAGAPNDPLHLQCDYPCEKKLECGHVCKARCSEECNCFMRVQRPLECSHVVRVGTEKAEDGTETVVTKTVKHAFDGACVERNSPCQVPVPIECRHCMAAITVPCHAYQAAVKYSDEQRAAAGDSALAEDKPADGAAAIDLGMLGECDECVVTRARLEKELRVELLQETDAHREQLRLQVEGQMHEQAKAAKAGMFHEGARVSIRDVAGVHGAIDYLFPEVASKPTFNGWCEIPIADLHGETGRIVGRHVDLTDTNEVLYLVALARGGHTVVADKGLELLRGVIQTSIGGPGGGFGSSILMIAGGPSSASAYVQTNKDEADGDGDGEKEAEDVAKALRDAFKVGTFVHCIEPVLRLSDTDVDAAAAEARADAEQKKKRDEDKKAAAAEGDATVPDDDNADVNPFEHAMDDDSNVTGATESNICGSVARVEPPWLIIRCERVRHTLNEAAIPDTETPAPTPVPTVAPSRAESDADNDGASEQPPRPKVTRSEAGAQTAGQRTQRDTEVFLVRALASQVEALLGAGEAAVAREPRRHVFRNDERVFFDLPEASMSYLHVPLAQNESVVVRGVVNYPYIQPGLSALWGRSRGPCYVVSPTRDTSGRVTICPVIFVEPDAELQAERELRKDLVSKLHERVAVKFREAVETRIIGNLESRAKRSQFNLKVYRRQVAANGGAPPVQTVTWGDAEKSALLAPPTTDRPLLDRASIPSAIHRNEVFVKSEDRFLKDIVSRFNEQNATALKYDGELCRALSKR